MKRLYVVLLSLVFFILDAAGQQSPQRKLDSLLFINNHYHQEDSIRVANLRGVIRQYAVMRNWEKYNLYADSAIAIAVRLPDKISLALVYFRLGAAKHSIDRIQAMASYNKAIETAKGLGSRAWKVLGDTYLNLGSLYMEITDYVHSLEAHEQALNIYVKMNNPGYMADCYQNMSNILDNMGQRVKAIEYGRKALAIFETNGDGRGVAVALQSLGLLYLSVSDSELQAAGISQAVRYREALTLLQRGLKVALTDAPDDVSLVAGFYRGIGQVNEMQGNDAAAISYYLQAVATNGSYIDDTFGDNLIAAGRFYVNKKKDFARGITMMRQALIGAEMSHINTTLALALETLSDAYEKKKDFDSSLFFYKRLVAVRNDIYNKEKEQEITRRQLKIDFDIKERDYRGAQQLADARLKQQEQEILLRSQQLQISDKEKTLQRLTFLQKQADLEAQKHAQQNQLTQERLRAEYDKQTSDNQINLQNIQLTLNRRLSVFLAIVAIIVIITAMIIYNSRKKTIRLNKLVSEQKHELEELVGVKDRIFSVVSHDLRGPVNNLVAFSTLLEGGDIQQERLQLYMRQIRGTLDHTSALMENLLSWAASQMKGFSPAIEKVDISLAIQHALRGAEQQMFQKDISLNNEVIAGMFVQGDKNMIEVIVRNLVNNAVKFSPRGSSIRLVAEKQDGNIVFSVHDSGIGIDPSKAAIINNAASTTVESTAGTAKERGTGLGLMLSKHFATLMGGKISVSSVVGEGSCFSVYLRESC